MSKKHKHNDHEEHIDESWLIPYADLLTLLLALFIVLYAMSSVDAAKFEEMSKAFSVAFNTGAGVLENTSVITTGTQKDNREDDKKSGEANQDQEQLSRQALMQQEQEDLEKLKKQLDEYIQKNGFTSQLDTRLNHSQLMITISDTTLFASGSATVKPESRRLAVAIADMLQQYPDYKIIVAGHTDNEPISTAEFESNWELSSKRAIHFMNILLLNPELDRTRFSAVAYGEYQPVASNATNAGRAENRRVEVQIIRKYIDMEKVEELSVPSD
ncbi:flagellar motor protein MotB [Paenibacillus abyssi]|uniref:Flagellar motor protein MotB n=1 Tax=Paenibacillus abyssi TaxID=1340531 RepID=A0A917LI45_9BACL|nr:flagellar motor protein MotB [Paenibacillus abyssi]GGG25467.1 flagellar motor protein MotB [Paenibacillus abyssi]